MQHLSPIAEEEMVAVFLQAEIASTRFSAAILTLLRHVRQDRRIIDRPDLASTTENACRRALLGEHRSYRRDADVFKDFPGEVRWYRALAAGADLAAMRYINDDYWIELSGGSRLAVDAAVRTGKAWRLWGSATEASGTWRTFLKGGATSSLS